MSFSALMDYEDLLVLEPRDVYDKYILGVMFRSGQDDIVCYDLQGILKALQSDGMDEDGAREFFDFNILGAYMGSTTPCFLDSAAVKLMEYDSPSFVRWPHE